VAIMSFYVVQESQLWKLYNEDPSTCAIVMRTLAGLVYLLACLVEPFKPSFSVKLIDVDCCLVLHYSGWMDPLVTRIFYDGLKILKQLNMP